MSLTDTILDQIDAYQMEQLDAETNVIKAHMEACMRDINIHMECERAGIIMEGDIIPKRDGENIFKYILFFLPRLVINILRKFTSWATGNPEIRTAEELKELARKREAWLVKNRREGLAKTCRKNVVDAVNYSLREVHPSAKCVAAIDKDGAYTCKWGIKSLGSVLVLYQTYSNYFEKYIEVFQRLYQRKDLVVDNEHNQDIIEFERVLSEVRSKNIAEGVVSNELIHHIEMDIALKLEKDYERGEFSRISKHIQSQMDKLIALYHKMDRDAEISQSNLRFATRYYDSITDVFNAFIKFNTYLKNAVDGVAYVYKIYPEKINNIFIGQGKVYDDEGKGTYEDILKEKDFDKPKYHKAKKQSEKK